jgi:isoquinoline 1-oxidoreductase beta subunit
MTGPATASRTSLDLTRRRFLEAGAVAGVGLLVGFHLRRGRAVAEAAEAADAWEPNAFIRIAPDDTVTVIAKHVEVGQGTYTGLATIVAEELDADWSRVRVESAPADQERYKNLETGSQMTGGSSAMANSWEQLRHAGAVARAMLVAAAVTEWEVPADEITVERGVVLHAPSNRRATFGELANKAAQVPQPTDVKLKDPKDWKLIGTHVPRVDSKEKTDGSAMFTMDVYLPDMLTALIARPPRFGGKVRSFDPSAALEVKGVRQVVEVPTGVAVLADGFWAARQGRAALKVEWDDTAAETRGTEELFNSYRTLAQQPGMPARHQGDAVGAIDRAQQVLEAVYEFPYLAHAPMEPLDCVVRLGADGCEVWAGCQAQTTDQYTVAKVFDLPVEKVKIHTLFGGGSFGRRATPNGDVAGEAASIVKAIGGRYPVKLIWTREDDIRGGRYRPLYVHNIRAGLDSSGRIVGWQHRIVGQSILRGTPFEHAMVGNGIDGTSVEGAVNLPYAVGDIAVELQTTDVGVPVLWWRSVGSTHTAFSTETFIDELAHAAKRDPVEYRRKLLKRHPRHLGALDLAAEKAGWGTPLPAGRARGVAVHESFNTAVAQIAEVSLGADGLPRVERVVCAVDCGTAITPDVVRAQMEGGIGFGLGAALLDEITLFEGRVMQSNFHDYRPIRVERMPAIEVHIVPSTAAPTGVGEPGVPPIAPAVANAMFELTGRRVRRLPFARNEA